MLRTHSMQSLQFGMHRSTQRKAAGVAATGAALLALMGGTASAADNSTGDQFVASATATPTPSGSTPTPESIQKDIQKLLKTTRELQQKCHLREGDSKIETNDDGIKYECHDAIQAAQQIQKDLETTLPGFEDEKKDLKDLLEKAEKNLNDAHETNFEESMSNLGFYLLGVITIGLLVGAAVAGTRKRSSGQDTED